MRDQRGEDTACGKFEEDHRAKQKQAALDAFNYRLRLLQPFLDLDDVQEIAVNTPGSVQLWKSGVWVQQPLPELNFDYLLTIANNLSNFVGKDFNRLHPTLSAHLPSGERVEVTHPPVAPEGCIYLNIRKHSPVAYAHDSLVAAGYYTRTKHDHSLSMPVERREFFYEYLSNEEKMLWRLAKDCEWGEFMVKAVELDQNIVVSGSTGSGKTSYIRSLIELIPSDQRIITVEDTPEMPLPNHPNHNRLLFVPGGDDKNKEGASAQTVLHSCKRKTPKRVMLAELRGEEAMFYLSDVLAGGHPGGMTTTHANSARDAFFRLALLIKTSTAGSGMDFGTILNLLYSTVNVVVQLTFKPEIGRFVPSVYYDPMHRLSLLG
jgi:type IV secretion system protein VirB11